MSVELELKYQVEEESVQKYREGLRRGIQNLLDKDTSGVVTAQTILFLLQQDKI